MTIDTTSAGAAWLAEAAAAGTVHTVRVSWSDRLGAWRGKRLPVEEFLRSPNRRVGFCDGMIVVDVSCDVVQETPFTNFETGYPDMYLRPDLGTLRPVGWAQGEAFVLGTLESHGGDPLKVAPRNVLAGVVDRLAGQGVRATARLTLAGRLMRSPAEPVALLPGGLERGAAAPGLLRTAADGLLEAGVPVRSIDAHADGTFCLALGPLEPVGAADAAVIAKAALKEVALAGGCHAVFMTRVPGSAVVSELQIGLELTGAEALRPERVHGALQVVRALLQPSITAFKAGAPRMPAIASAATPSAVVVGDLRAASEADPATALAAVAAAVGFALDDGGPLGAGVSSANLASAAQRLEETPWVANWLGGVFVENAVPLLRHEVALFDAAVTDWELDRYWTQG